MPLPKEQAWFPIKRYGYGWGLPCQWQGWLSLIVYISVVTLNHYIFSLELKYSLIYTLVLTILFILLVYIKGENSRWQWGDHK